MTIFGYAYYCNKPLYTWNELFVWTISIEVEAQRFKPKAFLHAGLNRDSGVSARREKGVIPFQH